MATNEPDHKEELNHELAAREENANIIINKLQLNTQSQTSILPTKLQSTNQINDTNNATDDSDDDNHGDTKDSTENNLHHDSLRQESPNNCQEAVNFNQHRLVNQSPTHDEPTREGDDNNSISDNAIIGQDNAQSIDDKLGEQNKSQQQDNHVGTDLKESCTKEKPEQQEEEEDLEEGELKDDDEDDDEDDDDDNDNENASNFQQQNENKIGYNNDNNNNTGFTHKDSSFIDNRHHDHQHAHHQHHQNYPPHHTTSAGPMPPGYHQLQYLHHQNRRQMSPGQAAEMHGLGPYPPNHHFGNNSNNNHYRYPPGDGGPPGPPIPMNHHPQAVPGMYPRGGPGAVGPIQKVNIRCRFYSKTSNKCTWGDHCRFEHRDDSPGPLELDNRPPGGSMGPLPPGTLPGARPPTQIPMSAVERAGHYPPYGPNSRNQPYPPAMVPTPYGTYEPYPQHHSTPPPLPPHHWRQQHSPYPSPSSNHPPESISPSLHQPSSAGSRGNAATGNSQPVAGGSSAGSGSSGGPSSVPISTSISHQPLSGALSPGGSYPSPSSSSAAAAVVYERKHRLAYELAPWNDSRGSSAGYPPSSKYDRGDPSGPYPPMGPGRSSFYRNHHYSSREPYGREPLPPHLAGGGGYPANYPSAYRAGPMGHHNPLHHPYHHHASHYNKFMSSSQRSAPSDARRSRSNKRGHDEDESSWSDSGSDDSILGQANYGNKNQPSSAGTTNKSCKLTTQTNADNDDQAASNEPLDEGSGTPPGEPLPEDRERQEMLLNKLKEIEDLMAKKKGEQD